MQICFGIRCITKRTGCKQQQVLNNSRTRFICRYFFFWRNSPQRARASSFTRFVNHTQRRTTVGGTPLDEWSAHRRGLYLTTHNTHNRQTSMPRRDSNPQSQETSGRTYALDRAATRYLHKTICSGYSLRSALPLRRYFKWLAGVLSPRRTGFDSGPGCVGFVVDTMALEQVSVGVLLFPL